MRSRLVTLPAALVFVALTGYAPIAAPPAVAVSVGPSLQSIGPLSFSADGTMFAADTQAATITAPVTSETGGVPYDKVPAMAGVQQLDLLDAAHSLVIAGAGSVNLTAVELP